MFLFFVPFSEDEPWTKHLLLSHSPLQFLYTSLYISCVLMDVLVHVWSGALLFKRSLQCYHCSLQKKKKKKSHTWWKQKLQPAGFKHRRAQGLIWPRVHCVRFSSNRDLFYLLLQEWTIKQFNLCIYWPTLPWMY